MAIDIPRQSVFQCQKEGAGQGLLLLHPCFVMSRQLKESLKLDRQHGKAVNSCRLLSCRPLSSVSKMEPFKDAMRSDKLQP